jgi:hypothetical protein
MTGVMQVVPGAPMYGVTAQQQQQMRHYPLYQGYFVPVIPTYPMMVVPAQYLPQYPAQKSARK